MQPTPLSTSLPVGLALRPRRVARRRVSLPVAVLALATLCGYWCWDSRRRLPLGASLLLSGLLSAQLMYGWSPRGLVLPVQLDLAWVTGLPLFGGFGAPAPATALVAPSAPEVVAPAELAVAAAAPASGEVIPDGALTLTTPLAPWQPSNAAILPYPEHIESWRPLVRELLAEAWSEGRLDGRAAQLDDDLVLAVIRQESQGNPNALSWAGAMGLMQVMPFTFADMMHGDRSLTCEIDTAAMWDVRSNVRAGLRYLSLALNAHDGNVYWALASYNAGIDAVHDWRSAGLYAVPPAGGYWETADYAQVILRDYLRRRPDVATLIHVPDPMPVEHVSGALRALNDLPTRPPEYIPRCQR